MKRILMGTKGANDMTSFLRAWGIFTRPEMRGICEPIRQPDDSRWVMDWSYFRGLDCVYLHRPHNVMDAEIIQRCKDYGVPLWVDHDDDLENVTPDNPVYPTYAGEQTRAIIKLSIEHADILTVGGAVHQKRLQKEFNREVLLIPGSVDDDLIHRYGKAPAHRKGQELRFSWRGSISHQTDLLYYAEVLREEIQKEGQWRFFGLNPYHLGSWSSNDYNYSFVPPTRDLFDFYRQFSGWNADIQFVGLLETEFNRVKSNLAWTDGTLAGSLVIAPSLPEYDRPGVIHYVPGDLNSLREAFGEARARQLMDPHLAWNESMAFINEHLRSSKINELRIQIVKEKL